MNFATAPAPINKTIRDVIDRAAIILTPQLMRRLYNVCGFFYLIFLRLVFLHLSKSLEKYVFFCNLNNSYLENNLF